MMNANLEMLFSKLRDAQEKKKLLEQIKLENDIDISSDKCYIILVGQINLLKLLIKEIENEERRFGGFGRAQ